RDADGKYVVAVGGDQDVVLDPGADAAELARDRMHDLFGLGLLFFVESSGSGCAQPQASLEHLRLAEFAQVEGGRLAGRVEVEAGLNGEYHAGLEVIRAAANLVNADVADVHSGPVSRPGPVAFAVVKHSLR